MKIFKFFKINFKIFMIIMILCKYYGIPQCINTLNVPTCSQHWLEDGFVETETCSKKTNVLVLC